MSEMRPMSSRALLGPIDQPDVRARARVLVPGTALAQDQAPGPVQVQVQAMGSTGVAGIALLAPAGDGTAVQVLVMGAPEGTSAVIHPGGCDVADATLVALLGDLGAGGQVQVTVPVPFETLADGGHVVAFHPGLDMTTLVGCGVIPAVAAPPDVPAASLAPPAPSLHRRHPLLLRWKSHPSLRRPSTGPSAGARGHASARSRLPRCGSLDQAHRGAPDAHLARPSPTSTPSPVATTCPPTSPASPRSRASSASWPHSRPRAPCPPPSLT